MQANDYKKANMADSSIKKVARLAGVSIATVSRCINKPEKVTEQTRIKVQSAIENTGYTPNSLAQRFRSGKTHQVLVAVPSIGDPFFTKVMRGVRSAANALGYTIVIRETRQDMMSADEINVTLESKQADGLVLLNNMTFVAGRLNGADHPHLRPPAVQIDNAAAAREMTEYLIGQGHRRIGMICGRKKPSFAERERGFRETMQKARLKISNSWIFDAENSLDGGRRAARQILECTSRPTAVFCVSDELAIGCMHEFQRAGLQVPDDISVVGFDDIRYAEVTNPPLTTVRQPAEEMGERIVRKLCAAIRDEKPGEPETQVVPHQLVIRQSVATPRR